MTFKVFILYLVSIFGCIYHPLFGQSLSGSYTIGNADGTEDYPTLSAAIADLKAGTITGDIVFNIGNGTYHETMDLSSINNGSFTVTFSGASKDFTIIHPLNNIATDKSGISITNTNNVVLENFTLVMDDISDTKVFFDGNGTKGISISGASNIDLENLVLSNSNFVFSQSYTEYIASAVSLVDVEDVTVSSGEFSGAGVLIYLEDFQRVAISDSDFSAGQNHIYHLQEADTEADALTIDGNSFTGPFPEDRSAGAISVTGHSPNHLSPSFSSNLKIENNHVDAKVANSDAASYGIRINIQVDPIVRNNVVEDGNFGFYVGGSTNTTFELNEAYRTSNSALHLQNGGQTNIINNILTSTYRAVSVLFTSNVRMAHNTLYTNGTFTAARLQGVSGDSLTVLNNIFSVENTSANEAIYSDVTATNISIDNNLYSGKASTYTVVAYRLGGNNGVFNNAPSLSDWQANQTSYDQNSQSFIPSFAGSLLGGQDYHITDATSYRFGTFIEDIASDIDGDYRDVLDGIDVGADQYCSPTCVPPVPPTLTSFSPTSGPIGTQVTLTGSNFDDTPANNVVYFGATRATVLSASSAQLVVTVPFGATYESITVVTDRLAAQSLTPFQVTFESDGTLEDISFDESLTFTTGDNPYGTAIGDLDNDGKTDMVVISSMSQTMSVFRNTSSGPGDISFANKVDYTISAGGEVIMADFNGDGRLDIAIGSSNAVFSIFENTSDGSISFATRQDFVTTSNASSLAASDINLDGKIDLVIAEYDSDQVLIFENTGIRGGAISFTNNSTLITGDGPNSVVIEDIDQDGKPDIIVGNDNDATVSVFLKDGTLFGYAAKQDFSTLSRPDNIVTGDIDGDGKADIVVTADAHVLHYPIARLVFLLNTSTPGALSFTTSDIRTAAQWADLDDLNGDGILDFVYMDWENGLGLMGNPDNGGNFSLDDEYGIIPEGYSSFVVTGDLDNDTEPDLIMPGFNLSGSFVEVMRNLGSGTDFKHFSMDEQLSPAIIDANNHTISIDVVACTDLTGLIPEFELSPKATTAVASVNQQSGVTANDYTSAVTYVVTAEDGATQNWTVTVTSGMVDNLVETLEACESYEFNGNTLTASGQYFGAFTNVNGCDSLVTLNLTILDPTSGDENITACESYEWEGTIYSASGTYQEILTNAVGCDSTATLNLTILEPTSGDDAVAVCESYEWEGTVYTASGVYQEILMNSVGCDSTATLNLTILEPTSGDDDVEACESYEWEGTVYTASGTYQEILTNAVGCDSTATLNLTILEPTSGDDDVEACESYEWEGMVYTVSGTYQEILTNSVGCDSTATLNLTILESTSGDDDVEACESYEWEGTVYTASGTYQEILTNAVGCDSTATLNLTILEPTSGDDDVEACESYEWEGMVYTVSGTYQEILTNSAGCDSTATLNLTILESTSGNDDVEACESYEWEGTLYSASGVYQEILTNAVGCDSTATLNLTILEPTSGDDDVEACGSYEWEGTEYTVSGVYQEVLTNVAGCDSTATLNLTILEPTSGDLEIETCESYEWEGTEYIVSGVYQEILTNAAGCDSTATLTLTILEPTSGDAEVEACESYEWEGTEYTDSGVYQEILTNRAGCDSTATLNLTILEPTSGDAEVEACESYEWEGTEYTVSGMYQEILTNVAGCDSTATLNLTILEPTFGNAEVEACESYEWEGTEYTVSGMYQEILTNSAGCDSTATLNLTILDPTSGDAEVEACESYEWEGTEYTVSGVYQEILTNATGCDSTATLNLTILEPTSGDAEVEACESYEWEGTEYTVSGMYQEILTNVAGCDSTATLNLTILEPTSGDAEVEACESYEWEGTEYTVSGVYQETLTNVAGCDSTATLNLTILESTFSYTEIEACDSYEWNNQIITEEGVYEIVLTNSVGCDSLTILDLSIIQATDSFEEVITCESYEWNGTNYNATGIYEIQLTNTAGCDSLAILDLTIHQEEVNELQLEACEPFEFGSQLISSSGVYQETFNNRNGCDSIVLLTMEMLPAPGSEIRLSGTSLLAEEATDGLTYQWINCETNQQIEGATNREFKPEVDGSYAVEISNGNCVLTSSCTDFRREDVILNASKPEGLVTVYPNPTRDQVTIKNPLSGSVQEIMIIGLSGKVLTETRLGAGEAFLFKLPKPGVYVIQSSSEEGIQTQKVLRN